MHLRKARTTNGLEYMSLVLLFDSLNVDPKEIQ